MHESAGLVKLDNVRSRLRIVGQSYGGVHAIPVVRIVGSLARDSDFDRDFRPRLRRSHERLASLRTAFPDGVPTPPIEVHEAGGAYFVADGHHRVALARERGAEFIEAEITHLATNYEIPPDVDMRQLVHTEQQRIFLEQSGLKDIRSTAQIEFSRPGGYPELLEIVKAYFYDAVSRSERPLDREQLAADWYDTVYLPGVAALRAEALPEQYAYKTDADLFLWIYQRRRALRVTDATTNFAAAARDARGTRVSHRFRREFLREKTSPLKRLHRG